jgi:predicted GNAT family N-acyltransferase
MNIEFLKFNGYSELLNIALNIRREVFVEEQQIDSSLEFDGMDNNCEHYLLYSDKVPIATSRLRKTNEGLKIERFAVLKNYRNVGFGKLLLDKILNDNLKTGERIYLNSQNSALSFYKKNGFKIIGDKFYEAGIEHYKMILTPNAG